MSYAAGRIEMTKLLSRNDVMQVLDMKDQIEILNQAFEDLAEDRAVMPQRTPITSPEYGELALFMPAYLKGMGALGAKEPIVQGDWFRPGTHINGVGSHAPAMRELDAATVARSKVVCDLVEACRAEAGDFIIPVNEGEWSWDKVHGSLGDVIAGKIPARENDQEITLFKSVGLAIQDISTAFHVYNQALEKGVGTDFDF
jgi:ornithine cyclodeaminase/alanine dehydrogenase-like protein (mu-crystallin family)